MDVLKKIAVWLGVRPKWLTEEMEDVISDCLSMTEAGSARVNIPEDASPKARALCRAFHYFSRSSAQKFEPIRWTDEDAQAFLSFLLMGELQVADPAKADIVNAESVVVFEAIRQAFTYQKNPSPISVDPRLLTLVSSFTIMAIQYDSFERIDDTQPRTLLANSLVALLNYIRICIKNGHCVRLAHGTYFVGELELPVWLVEKYRTDKTPKKI